LQYLSGQSPEHPLGAEILLQVSNLRTSGQSVVFCWLLGYCGLPWPRGCRCGNCERTGPLVSDRALGTDVCTCLRRAILSSWQATWDSAVGNELRMVRSSVQEWQ
jgi:hypothetical protein